MSQKETKEILENYSVIAVIGLSREPDKPSYEVADYMKRHGYRIIPVNPFADEILGEKSYKSLLDIPAEIQKTVEVVDIFRRPEDVPPIVDQVLKLKQANGKPYVVWMQQDIINEQAAKTALKAGLLVIMDRCIMVEHQRLSPH